MSDLKAVDQPFQSVANRSLINGPVPRAIEYVVEAIKVGKECSILINYAKMTLFRWGMGDVPPIPFHLS